MHKHLALALASVAFVTSWVSADEQAKPPETASQHLVVTAVPEKIRDQFSLQDFYQQCLVIGGMPIVASDKVQPSAIKEAAIIVSSMLQKRPDILRQLAENRIRLTVMSTAERTCDVPEHSDLTPKDYWNRRARGLGATRARPSVSCGEENLLNLRGDPYDSESILIHEFAHAIHLMALRDLDDDFQAKLDRCYNAAIENGRWKDTYAASNDREYWAEGVQSWFDCNRENDSVHNHVNTRDELKTHDPELYALIRSVFIDESYRYVRSDSAERKNEPHLKNLDRNALPKFRWEASEKPAKKASSASDASN